MFYDTFFEEERPSRLSRKEKYKLQIQASQPWKTIQAGSYQCAHCKNHFLTASRYSGVQNRNHCPYCLWSLHLDLDRPGDRMSACRGLMQPLGLSVKRIRKKYAPRESGEVMIVHRCVDCGKISLNRIAADDDTEALLELAAQSASLDKAVALELETQGISVLPLCRLDTLRSALSGTIFLDE